MTSREFLRKTGFSNIWILLAGITLLLAGCGGGGGSTSSSSGPDQNPSNPLPPGVSGTFKAVGSMGTARTGPTATSLNNGKVLVTGGASSTTILASAELFDPSTAKFTPTGSMQTARGEHTATLLNSGKVLIVGGFDSNFNELASAELFDPTSGAFTPTGSMGTARISHTATLLPDGTVLVTGGLGQTCPTCSITSLASAEIYNPSTGLFTATGSLSIGRFWHKASLSNGKVLITGGITGGPGGTNVVEAEMFDPSTGSFGSGGTMVEALYSFTATSLPDGHVLIAGGVATSPVADGERFDPTSGFSSTGSMTAARAHHTATLLGNGKVLLAGGGNTAAVLSSAELYDDSSGTFTTTGGMATPRSGHAAALLSNGIVLVMGGTDNTGTIVATAEAYTP